MESVCRNLNVFDGTQLFEQIKRHEGSVRNKRGDHIVYRCPSGKFTVGYGHNLESSPLPGWSTPGYYLTEVEAEELLRSDIYDHEKDMLRLYPWARGMNGARYGGFVDFCFNLGLPKVSEFKNSLKLLRDGEYVRAAANMMKSKWAKQVGQRARTVTKEIETGEWI